MGCCSLRREHITFNEDSSVHEIDLEFLGKDSMLFKQTIDFDKYGEVGTKVFQNIQAFCKNKRQSQEVFDRLDPRYVELDGLGARILSWLFLKINFRGYLLVKKVESFCLWVLVQKGEGVDHPPSCSFKPCLARCRGLQ